ncbi:unnamed protein product [Schistocephalus solidus]|uniref:Uncharacterized protein n=1 Tax=Schistocephalus solidus TaxID=70667 RepID=A0A183T4C5_SCHSO|nr:unnamed protein product [Schistocephalus solidus]
MHSHNMAVSAEATRPAVPTPLTLGGETTVPTCRFRPGLRPIRILDMKQFRLRRRPNQDPQAPSSSSSSPKSFKKPVVCSATLPKPTTTTSSSRRQPLKAFPQDTVSAQMSLRDLSLQSSAGDAYPTSSKASQLSCTERKSTRITTNPVYRRHSSASLTQSSSGDDEILKPDEDSVPGNSRKSHRHIETGQSRWDLLQQNNNAQQNPDVRDQFQKFMPEELSSVNGFSGF